MSDTHASRTLRRLRDELGKSRQQVAADLNISERTLIRHEMGTTPLSRMHVLAYADYFGVDADVFAAAGEVAA